MECLASMGIALAGSAVWWHLQSKARVRAAMLNELHEATTPRVNLNDEPYVTLDADFESMTGKQVIHEYGHEPRLFRLKRTERGRWRRKWDAETRRKLVEDRREQWREGFPIWDKLGEDEEEDLKRFAKEVAGWEELSEEAEDELEANWQRRAQLLGALGRGG